MLRVNSDLLSLAGSANAQVCGPVVSFRTSCYDQYIADLSLLSW